MTLDSGNGGETLDELLVALRGIAERAGQATLMFYKQDGLEVTSKDDDSPLTQADLAADRVIREALQEQVPDIPIVSEEGVDQGDVPEAGARFWLVDPLDGTKEFISGNGEFTINIALIEHGQPVAGVVHAPALGMTWAGAIQNDGTAKATFAEVNASGKAIGCRQIPPAGATVVASRRHGDPEEMKRFLGGYTIAEQRDAGSSIKFCLVASGQADLYPRFGRTMEWDTAAGHAVLAAAGGRVTDAAGNPLTYGKPDYENPPFIAYGLG
ncbi:3'(2'),5'-bisphosphate nucleotidase CysQ [Rhodovibrio salinarum]|uniref:3'(2'),5'-bisphosphate nucleotidase CysQ n=1 Tax=Rhodovibrio salinarum TaxID=1087 RepID=A0A934QKX6_9PROT|nr:3'(2'),5'-bisphosphate nucleotidase CysQ [Rhodovibrio salinarum]MBK1698823.1 3'(2'),5'-bisphosphate nucleotidase [Rhodovibrio salinarum]